MIEAPCILTCVARYTVGTFHLYIYKKEMTEGIVVRVLRAVGKRNFKLVLDKR